MEVCVCGGCGWVSGCVGVGVFFLGGGSVRTLCDVKVVHIVAVVPPDVLDPEVHRDCVRADGQLDPCHVHHVGRRERTVQVQLRRHHLAQDGIVPFLRDPLKPTASRPGHSKHPPNNNNNKKEKHQKKVGGKRICGKHRMHHREAHSGRPPRETLPYSADVSAGAA